MEKSKWARKRKPDTGQGGTGATALQFSGGEGVLIHPPHQGVCGWHGTEEQWVTSGRLIGSPGSAEDVPCRYSKRRELAS